MPGENLTAGQRKAAGEILDVLGSTGKKLVFLEGLPGTGRHLLLNSIAPDIAARGGVVNEQLYHSLSFGDRERTLRDMMEGHIVAMGSMREVQLLRRHASKQYPAGDLVTVQLQAMTPEESLGYTQSLSGSPERSLTPEQLAQYSLGIHTLAQMLSVDPNISISTAARIAGAHIGQDLVLSSHAGKPHIGMGRFLQVEPPKDVLEIAKGQNRPDQRHIYNQAGSVLRRVFDLRKQGIEEASPLFVSPQSVDLYNKWMKTNPRAGVVKIFTPEIPAAGFADLNRAFGLDYARENPGYGIQEGTRTRAFGGNSRGANVWFREPSGRAIIIGFNEKSGVVDEAKKYETQFNLGKFPLSRRLSDQATGSFLLLTTGEGVVNVKRAWMVESWLQQKGLAYFVQNSGTGDYTYNPDTANINLVSKRAV